MKRLAALITGAMIALALGVTLGVPSRASASFPPPEPVSYSYQLIGPSRDGYTWFDHVQVYRDRALAGDVYFSVAFAANHLGQHAKSITIQNRPGANLHIRVDAGSSVVDYHATAAGAPFTHTFYYGVRKFRVTLDGWASPWFAPPS